MRDEFSERVKRSIAGRVGNQCSNPGCSAATSGPQLTEEKALNVGVAAHIAAAAQGGPRFNPQMSVEVRRSAGNAIWLCQTCAKLIDNDEARFTSKALISWKRQAEAEALAAIGKTKRLRSARVVAGEREIRRNLKVRNRLERSMLRSIEERRAKRATHPYEKFRVQRIIVRSVEDTRYPEVDSEPSGRISSWFNPEPYDFYHGGLEIIIRLRLAAIDKEGNWSFVEYRSPVDEAKFRLAKVWHLGRIPWRNIREIDTQGDEYYREPHLYCAFTNDGMPYEEFVAVEAGDDCDGPLLDWSKKRECIT